MDADTRLARLRAAARASAGDRLRALAGAAPRLRAGARIGVVLGVVGLALAAALLWAVDGPVQTFLGLLVGFVAAYVLASSAYVAWLARSASPSEAVRARHGEIAREVSLSARRFDTSGFPAAVVDDWRRLHAARRTLLNLAVDGWIDAATLADVEGRTSRLGALLELGSWDDPDDVRELHARVRDLSDLLFGLGDLVVERQERPGAAWAPVTLAQAHDHLPGTARPSDLAA